MKKLLALVLAVSMCLGMGVMAFAAADVTLDGDTNEVKIEFDPDDEKFSDLKVSAKWDKGKKYVESVELDKSDSNYYVVINLADYYGTDEEDIAGTITVKKGSRKADITGTNGGDAHASWTANECEVDFTIGWDVIDGPSGNEDFEQDISKADGYVIAPDNTNKNGVFTFTENDAQFEVKLAKQDDLNLFYTSKPTSEIKKLMVKNSSADVEVFSFPGKPTFDFSGTLTYYVSDPDEKWYMYELTDKGLKEVGKYDKDDDCFTLKTRTLGTYLISDKALKGVVDDDDDDTDDESSSTPSGGSNNAGTNNGGNGNPNTGVSDFTGVAVALGAVSLVAAGAAAFKRKK